MHCTKLGKFSLKPILPPILLSIVVVVVVVDIVVVDVVVVDVDVVAATASAAAAVVNLRNCKCVLRVHLKIK